MVPGTDAPRQFVPSRQVAALYVNPRSVYAAFCGVQCWGIERDARNYPGPHPIVAHPPCGHWGKYSARCKLPGEDCAPIAIGQVRKFGGVIEHPAGTRLYAQLGIPRDGLDLWGGLVLSVNQCDWGHVAQKPTVLYFVRCSPPPLPTPRRPQRPLESLSALQRSQTPIDFAAWLLDAARSVQ